MQTTEQEQTEKMTAACFNNGHKPRVRRTCLAGALCLASLLAALGPLAPSAHAQAPDFDYLLVPNLRGTYAFQFTGTVSLPAPFDGFNGPFVRTGRFSADGYGNLTGTVVSNYAGNISRDNFVGTYKVNGDGTFSYTILNLSLPPLAGIPNVFTFDGVIANGGKNCKVMLSGVVIAGQPQANVGSVIFGEFIKQ